MNPLLTLEHVGFAYHQAEGETPALSVISFTLEAGHFLAIVGPSGCGKSTLLSLISGLLLPEEGRILLHGLPVREARANIGYMLQRDHLFEWRTVYTNVLLGLEIQHQKTPEKLQKVDHMLDSYGLSGFRNARPSQLSGGMRQRAALIRTLALEPDLLLLGGQIAKSFSWFGKELERECEKRKIRIQIETETSGRAMEGLLSQFPEKTQ